MSEPDVDPCRALVPNSYNNIDDPLEGVSDPPSSSLSPHDMHFPSNEFESTPRRPGPGPMMGVKYKSWKKKYNKMRHGFKKVMATSDRLFEEAQKLERVARRLKEQNDQLLEFLLDVNSSKRLDPSLRYDLRSPPPSESAVPGLESDDSVGPAEPAPAYTTASARALVAASAAELAADNITPRDHEALLARVRAGLGPAKPLALLEDTAHTPLAAVAAAAPAPLPDELRADDMLGYMSAAHEDDYLAALDAGLDAPPGSSAPPPPAAAERSNPASTVNWLRRFKPDVLSAEPPAASTNGGGGGDVVDGKLEGATGRGFRPQGGRAGEARERGEHAGAAGRHGLRDWRNAGRVGARRRHGQGQAEAGRRAIPTQGRKWVTREKKAVRGGTNAGGEERSSGIAAIQPDSPQGS